MARVTGSLKGVRQQAKGSVSAGMDKLRKRKPRSGPAPSSAAFDRAQGAADARKRKAQEALTRAVREGNGAGPSLADFERIQQELGFDQAELSLAWLDLLKSGAITEKGLNYAVSKPPGKVAKVG
jgi:hypothetical protein